jgi:hypothetical protein
MLVDADVMARRKARRVPGLTFSGLFIMLTAALEEIHDE